MIKSQLEDTRLDKGKIEIRNRTELKGKISIKTFLVNALENIQC